MKQYIFIDIDGTLLDNYGKVPKSAIDAITQAQSNGHKVFINTGRAKSGMPPNVANLPFDGFVYSAGTVVEIGNEKIFFDVLTSDDVLGLASILEEQGLGYSLEGYNRSFYDDISGRIFEALNFKVDKEDKLLHFREYDTESDYINKLAIFAKEIHAFDVLKDILPNHLDLIIHDKNIHDIFLAEIIKNESNKATGIEKVLQHFGANQNQTICFGDSPNDFDMVEYCQLGVCMEDGSDQLKVIADDIAKPAGEDGIYHYFSNLGLINSSLTRESS